MVLSLKVSRSKLSVVIGEWALRVIAVEACPSPHHRGRVFQEAGHQIRLIHPRFVKSFVRGAKNDAVDAVAILEAASRPTMRFVPVKTLAQQDLQALHQIRELLVVQRRALINQARGLLAKYGIVVEQRRRNWTFAGSDAGGHRAAALYTLNETAKLNGINAQAWLADVLSRLPDHPARHIDDLLP